MSAVKGKPAIELLFVEKYGKPHHNNIEASEVLLGQQYTKSSDIYSLGIIMTEISLGRRASDGIPIMLD
ncbi:hypothetical protein C2G38_2230518 [Gigaspora rosea]|uniref:Protein kinase domain-containing protein n=1 Tax=Gigaspora rosea TaxID=44941 RepID=A0A397TTU0_9GLOM|nr:hypothetical protein C2G38_2230518 [Gigaspora rosea]